MIDPALLPRCRTAEDLQQRLRRQSRTRFFFDEADRGRIVNQARAWDPVGVAAVIAEAERILDNRVYVHGFGEVCFGDRVVWFESPYRYRDKLLSRHDFIPTLIQAYWYTSDRRFAERAVALWRDWINQPGRLRLDNSVDNSIRIQNWLWIVYAISRENFLTADDFVRLLSEVYRSGFRIEADMLYAGNHRIIEALGLWCIGLLLPELQRASYWRSKGETILWEEIQHQVFPDGVHMEMSSGYHIFVTTHFLKFYLLSRANNCSVPEQFQDRLGKMLVFAEAMRKPDGGTPMLGDGDALRTRDREHRESELLAPALSLFRNGTIETSIVGAHSDLVSWYLGNFAEERPGMPVCRAEQCAKNDAAHSIMFSNAGYVLMRTGCASQGHSLLMDAGPFGMNGLSHHGHADALHLEICTSGESLVVDPGGYGYINDQWRRFFRSTRAHSTVEVDGLDQSEIFGVFGVGRTARCTITTWFTNERIDFVEALHDGYRTLPYPVIHRRTILFVKPPPAYWIIIDSLEGHGEHGMDLLFHLTPEAHLGQREEGRIVIRQARGTSTEFGSLLDPPDMASVIVGQMEPQIQGWVSRTTGDREKAPVLSFRKQGQLPQVFATLIRPENSIPAGFAIREASLSQWCEGSKFAWEFCWPETIDKVSITSAVQSSPVKGRMSASVERSVSGRSAWYEATQTEDYLAQSSQSTPSK